MGPVWTSGQGLIALVHMYHTCDESLMDGSWRLNFGEISNIPPTLLKLDTYFLSYAYLVIFLQLYHQCISINKFSFSVTYETDSRPNMIKYYRFLSKTASADLSSVSN